MFNVLKIKRLIEEKNIGKESLAQKIGIKKQTFYNYINGTTKIPAEILPSLSEILNVPVDFFFNEESLENVSDININYSKGNNNIQTNGIGKKNEKIKQLESQLEFFTYRYETCENIIKEKERVIESLQAQIELLKK